MKSTPHAPQPLLLVDDDPSQLKLYKLALQEYGHTIKTALNGREAMDLFSHHDFAGVISDILMPQVDGYRLCQWLREDPRLATLPIVLLSSSYIEPGDVQLAKNLGANGLVERTPDVGCTVRRVLDTLQHPVPKAHPMHAIREQYSCRLAVQLEKQLEANRKGAHHTQHLEHRLGEFNCALMESQERFRLIEENIRDAFFLTGSAGMPLYYISPAYERIWGQTCESLYEDPRAWFRAILPEDRAHVEDALLHPKQGHTMEFRIRRPDGVIRWIRAHAFPVKNAKADGPQIIGRSEDITESKMLEEQFRHAQKMEAVGRLAGGVAHDINNLLGAIKGFGDFLSQAIPAQGQAHEDLQEMLKAADQAAHLTRQMLAFSRKQTMTPKIVDLRDLIQGAQKLIQQVIGQEIEMVLQTGDLPLLAKADASAIEQIFMNLAVNAKDAMPKGGRLEMSCHSLREADESIGMPLANYVAFSFRDTGIGMSADIQSHLFEPFFTTKAIGQGTGLGLSTCYGLAKQSGGYIQVKSASGEGTTMTVFLPAVSAAA